MSTSRLPAVDDEQALLDLLQAALGREGYEIVTASALYVAKHEGRNRVAMA